MAVDLHVHTTGSDGTLTPAQAVEHAVRAGLTALAITDHDSVVGIPEALTAGKRLGLDVFPAVEISCDWQGREVHLLGYLVDSEDPELSAVLQRIRDARWGRLEQILAKLRDTGVDLRREDVERVAQGESLGRPHVAQALVDRGVVNTPQDAFDRFLRRGRPAYVDRYRHPAAEAVGLVLRAQGLPVLAHPGLLGLDGAIQELAEHGLAGIEAYHVDHTPRQTAHYRAMAERLELLVTGGSDSHGPEGPKPVTIGQVDVPDECAEGIRNWGRAHGRWPWPEQGRH